MKDKQMGLDLEIESFSKREKFLIKRLKEHRTIDAEIAVQDRLARGIGLVHEPRVTAAAPERDYMRYLCHVGANLSEDEQ